MLNQENPSIHRDRIEALRQRVEQLKKESVDYQFNQYLDQVLRQLQSTEESITKAERHLEQNYQLYIRRNGLKLEDEMSAQSQPVMQQPVQPQMQQAMPMQSQPVMQQSLQPQAAVWNQPSASAPVPPNPGAIRRSCPAGTELRHGVSGAAAYEPV